MDTLRILVQTITPAVVVAIVALWRAHRVDRRNLMLNIMEQLIDPEKQRGRRLLHAYADANLDWWDAATPGAAEDRDCINSAIALFDIVGWYVEKDYVDADAVLELWAVPIVRCWTRAFEPYIKVRREREGWEGWRYFEALKERATTYLEANGQQGALARL